MRTEVLHRSSPQLILRVMTIKQYAESIVSVHGLTVCHLSSFGSNVATFSHYSEA